jgi:type IV pilus assembly protein PilC
VSLFSSKSNKPSHSRNTRISGMLSRGVNRKSVTHFTRQLANMIRRGIPLSKGLDLLERQEKPGAFKRVIQDLVQNVRSGNPLSHGLARHPKVFNNLYFHMVRAGEASGKVDLVLDRLAKFMEKSQKVQAKIMAAMMYPLVVLTLAFTILGFLLVFVVPKFQKIYEDFLRGAPLPNLTQYVLNFSLWIQGNLLLVVIALIALIIVVKLIGGASKGRYIIDSVKLRIPLYGDLLRMNCLSRFSRTLGTLLGSAVPLLESLEITRAVVGNLVFQKDLETVYVRVRDGDPISKPLSHTRQFPAILCCYIEVGEESGSVPEVLNQIADDYEDELDTKVSALTSILEPIMIVLLAVIVGFIVVALFLPLIGIFESLA